MPKLSILVPVYNVADFLSSCLDSILNQTFTDYELICINDGSTDGCDKILDSYARKDERIKVIHKENTGYGHSMNTGLDLASGEYIGIVESDDCIEPSFFENLCRKADENDLDVIKGECKFVWDSEKYVYRYHAGSLNKYFDQVIPPERLYLRCRFLMNVWSGIYRRSFLVRNGIRFNESPGASYQDNGFWLQTMIFAERVMFIKDAGYLYRQDNFFSSVKDSKKIYAMSNEYDWIKNRLLGKISSQQMDIVNAFGLVRGYWSFLRIDDSKKREFCDRLVSDYKKYESVFRTNLTWQENYYPMVSDPDNYCERFIAEKRELERKMQEADSLIIYGAGKMGQRLFRLFCDMGWRKKLQCFVETGTPGIDKIGTVPVYRLGSEDIMYHNVLVIIAVEDTSGAGKAMRTECAEHGLDQVVGCELFFTHYPMLT